jgi:hypothetical protein
MVPGMVARAYNPSTLEVRQEDGDFKASLGYIVRTKAKHPK